MSQKLAHPGFWMATALVLVTLGIQIVLAIPLGPTDVVLEEVLHQPRWDLARQPLIVGSAPPISLWNTYDFRLQCREFEREFA